jgi:hypothetical protein
LLCIIDELLQTTMVNWLHGLSFVMQVLQKMKHNSLLVEFCDE